MLRKLALTLLLCVAAARPAFAQAGPCQASAVNTSLGNGWTRVDCNAQSGAITNPTNLLLKNNAAVNAHDTIVAFCDVDQVDNTGTVTIAITDNASNTFTKSPLQDGSLANGTHIVKAMNWWYVLDSQAKATGYQMTCTGTESGGGAQQDMDSSVFVLRQASGLAARGVEPCGGTPGDIFCGGLSGQGNGAAFGFLNDQISASGTCPCATVNMTPVGPEEGAVLIGGGNMNGAPSTLNATYTGCDGDGINAIVFFYTFCATIAAATPNPPGASQMIWTDNTASDHYAEGLFTILPARVPPLRLLTGAGR